MRAQYFNFFERDFTKENWKQIREVIKQFYLNSDEETGATSSHWLHFREFQKMSYQNESHLRVSGFGFGDYENRIEISLTRRLVNIPTKFASWLSFKFLPTDIQAAIISIARKTDRILNQDMIRLGKSLKSITGEITDLEGIRKVAIIGDGYGTFGSILMSIFPQITVVQVNLGRALLFDMLFSGKALPEKKHVFIEGLHAIEIGSCNYLPAESIKPENAEIDLFICIASLQEMNNQTISAYFNLMRVQSGASLTYFANRILKILPAGEVSNVQNYGWLDSDLILFQRNPYWLNWGVRRRPPFVFRMDGVIEERLVQMSKKLPNVAWAGIEPAT